ncbi:MAG TPA: EAL domain-containing protein [Candidatus Wunengus sp. YC65]|uniref:EAL domain-containing protein n=1 Tax=Candidatus Wunengus sp. YC65 TaxID=3367701 RepID=UPI0040284D8E
MKAKPLLSFKYRLLIFALCISLIPITALTLTYYFHSRNTLKHQILENLRAIAEAKRLHVLCSMEVVKSRTADFSTDGFIKHYLEIYNRGRVLKKGLIRRLSNHLLKNKLPLNNYLEAIIVTNEHGVVVSSTQEELQGKSIADQNVFLQGTSMGYGQVYIGQPHYSPYFDTNCIYITAPILSEHDSEILGVVINVYCFSILNKITTNRIGMGETGEVYLVNKNKIMLTESRFIDKAPLKLVVDTEPIHKAIEGNQEMLGIYSDYRGVPVIGASLQIPEYGWILLSEIDRSEAFAPLKRLGIIALILGIVGSTSVIILGITITSSMSKPIKELTNATEILASGNLNHRVQISRNDEIGILANGFNTMAESLDNEITEHKLTEESLRESEQRFKTMFNSAIDGILVADPDTKKLFLGNNAICQMLGYTMNEIKTLSVADIYPKESLPYVLEQFEKQLRGGITAAKDIPVKRKDGSVFYAGINASRITLDKKTYLMGIFRDITEQKRILEELRTLNESLEQRVAERTAAVEKINEKLCVEVSEHKQLKEDLVYLADYDPLTNLFNRRRFQKEIDDLLAYSRRYGVEGTLLFLDLDNFKYLNDVHGHQVGDGFLIELAGLLKGRLRQTDIVARLGGDEFAIYLPQVDTNQAMVVAEGIAKLIEQHAMVIKGQQQPAGVTASIGVVLFPLHGTMPEELLTCADIAMYQAKKEGGNRVCVYNVDQKMEIESLLNWKNRIQVALAEDRFVLHFQPITDFNQLNIMGYEALLRMVDENGKLIPPSSFISVAEHFGLMREIDGLVVRRAIKLLAEIQKTGKKQYIEVNLSDKSFTDRELLLTIKKELTTTGINAANLVLTITENALMANMFMAERFIKALKDMGCRVGIDDFGIGFSSFNFLKKLPVDYLKIDGSLIQDITNNPVDQHLVRAMVEVARGLGKQTVAEFVENKATIQLLSEYGVDFGQGYYIGKPFVFSEKPNKCKD